MHILILHQAFATLAEPGGTRHHEMARYFVRQGHRVTVLTGQVSYLTGKGTDGGKWLSKQTDPFGIEIFRSYTYQGWHRSFLHRIFSFLSFMFSSFLVGLHIRDIDLIWGTTPPIFQGITAWILARIKKAVFLLEVRDLWPTFAIAVGVLRNPVLIRLSEGLERFLYRRADHVVINSPGFEEHVIRKGATDVHLVANGVDGSMFQPASDGLPIREEWGLKGEFIVLYAGAHGLSNDLETVLMAADSLREREHVQFIFVGDGKEKDHLIAHAKALELENIQFLPAVPKERMPEILAAADACVAILKPIEAYKTTYPNKVFDYMAAGRPVILAIDGVIREVVEEARAGIFCQPGDPEGMVEVIVQLEQNRARGKQMGLAGREFVEKHFDRDIIAQKMLSLMIHFLEGQGSSP
jgi:glycosyltransferase involved in cell wall biosynthesis